MIKHRLHPHPRSSVARLGPDPGLSVHLSQNERHLLLHYGLCAPPDCLRVPPRCPAPGPTDGLWQNCCFELFVGRPGAPNYLEFNFSPSGQWAAYLFDDQRQPANKQPASHVLAGLCVQAQQLPDGLMLQACVPLSVFALLGSTSGRLRLGLSAVIEDHTGQLSYWALHHPVDERPDFHHPDSWLTQPPDSLLPFLS